MIHQHMSSLRKLMLLRGATGGNPAIEATATGNPLTFITDLAKPLKSLVANFLPVQASGTPSPENILPITGWTGVNVEYYEENLYSGGDKSFTRYTKINLSNPLPAGTYFFTATVNSNAETNNSCIAFARNDNDVIAKAYLPKNGRNSVPFSVSDTVNIIYLYAGTHYAASEGASAVFSGIFITETAADRYPVTFPSTIFGGYVDMVTGEVWATHDGFTKKWSEYTSEIVLGNVARREFISPTQRPTETELNDDATSRYCNVATWRYNYMSDNIHFYGGGYSFFVFLPVGTDEDTEITIVTKKKSPILITTLTPQQINAIKGDNTIWSDANGDCEVIFMKKG